MNKSKILHLTIFLHFFTLTTFHKAFGTNLYNAIMQEDKKAVQGLLASGADVNVKDKNQLTPLYLSVAKGNSEIVQLLLGVGADVSVRYKNKNTPLYLAVVKGNSEIVQHLLEAGADPNAQHIDGKTPLYIAVEKENKEIVELLLAFKADVNFMTKYYGMSSLHLAIEKGNSEIVQLLLKAGADVNARCESELRSCNPPLHIAVGQENKELVELLLRSGANVNANNRDDLTPLHIAVKKRNKELVELLVLFGADVKDKDLHIAVEQENKELVELLLASGANVNARGHHGATPLHIAVQKGNKELVELLCLFRADIEAQDNSWGTPLQYAIQWGNRVEIVKLLIAFGADVNTKGILHRAAESGNTELVKFLIASGAEVKTKDQYSMTPLHFAARWGHTELVKFLIASGAEVNARGCSNRRSCREALTPLGFALEWRINIEVVKLLIAAGAEVNAQNEDEDTPLHIAADRSRHTELIEFLIASGAEVRARNKNEDTPLHRAAESGNTEVVKLFIAAGAEVNAQNKNENTPLHFAIKTGRRDTILLLLELGADAGILNSKGNSSLHEALQAVLDRIGYLVRNNDDFFIDKEIKNRINIFIELLLLYQCQTYSDQATNQQTNVLEVISNLNRGFLNENNVFLDPAKNLIKWIIAEVVVCESKQEFFQKIFNYLLNSYPEDQQNLLIENIQHLILKEHQVNLYPRENTLSESKLKKLKAFKKFLRLNYAKKLKKELFNDLSEAELEVKLEHSSTLLPIVRTIKEYYQNTPIKLPFLQILLEKHRFNQTTAIRDWILWYIPDTNPGSREVYNNIFKPYFKNMKCLVRDLYMHLKYIIDQPPGSDRLDSNTQFGRDETHQDILTFGKGAS